MAETTAVKLPRSTAPRFPQRCIFCGRSNPEATLKVRGHLIRWWTVVLALVVFFLNLWKPHSAEVPACTGCRTRFRRRQIARPLVAVLVGVPVLAVVAMSLGTTTLKVVEVLLVVFLPQRAIAVPAPVALAVFAKSMEFEFKDAAYALEFARLNEASVESA